MFAAAQNLIHSWQIFTFSIYADVLPSLAFAVCCLGFTPNSACVTLSQGACQPQTSEDGQSQYCTTSKTSVHHPCGTYLCDFFARSWAVKFSARCELAFLVEETAGIFTTNLSMSKFLSVFSERHYILSKNWQLRLFFTLILPTRIEKKLVLSFQWCVYISHSFG